MSEMMQIRFAEIEQVVPALPGIHEIHWVNAWNRFGVSFRLAGNAGGSRYEVLVAHGAEALRLSGRRKRPQLSHALGLA